MRVLLVGPDLESNLSLRYLASSLRAAGHEPRIATFDCAADAPRVVAEAAGFDLVGLSMCFQVRAPEFLDLARALKAAQPRRPVVAGGHFASCAATELLDDYADLDVIVIHEGERALVELADLGAELVAKAATVPGVAVREGGRARRSEPRPILDDLDALPPPDRSGPARLVAGVPTAYLMGSRGCVNACDYCCITTLHRLAPGRRFRQRAPEQVAQEMAGLFHERGVRQFVFHDDNFLVPSYAHNQGRLDRLEAALQARGVKDVALVLKCSPRDAEPRILSRLKGLGLIRIFMGIESGTQCGLDAIGRKQTVAEAERALSLCEDLDVSSQYTLIIFHPEATPDSMLADLEFAKRHPAHPLNYCRAEVYAGTPLERRLLDSGRAIGDYLARVYRYTDPRVERVWELGRGLFAGRCWGQDEILGQAIRLDHQLTVVRHFYEGAAVDRLARTWRELQVELNLDTAGLFSELVALCADPAAGEARAAKAIAALARRERKSREALHRRLCEVRADIEACTRLALPAVVRPAATRKPRVFRSVVPRHAAAVAVALGLAGYLPAAAGQDAGTPRVADTKKGKGQGARDGGQEPVRAQPFKPDVGVAEAAPPPYDWRRDQGVAEAPPPPLDERRRRPPPPPPPPRDAGRPPYLIDHGVAEAAPAPMPLPVVWRELTVQGEGLSVYLSGVGRISGTVTSLPAQETLKLKVNGASEDALFEVTFTRRALGEQVAVLVAAEPALQVKVDGRELGPSPRTATVQPGRRTTFELEEPTSHARLRVTLTVGVIDQAVP